MRPVALALLALALGTGCGGEESTPDALAGRTPEELVQEMRAAAAELAARPEHAAPEVTVQHLLVSFAGAGTGAQRTPADAERLAAELFARARAGEDFDLLVKNHTDDAHPGIYALSLAAGAGPGVFPRAEMVPVFGETAWRLAEGELGIALFDATKSPFGYHLVKRLE